MKKNIILLSALIIITLIFFSIVIIRKNHKQATDEEIVSEITEPTYNEGEFNLNLIKTVNANNIKNYLVSPYSIEIALNMLKEGSLGKTKEEITNVIGNREINDVTVLNRVSIANAAFIKNKYKNYVKKPFSNTLKEKYNSEILYDEYNTPDVINNWVNNKTDGMIDKILDTVEKDFVLGIANALAIDVEWEIPFDCSLTKREEFTKIDNKKMDAEMMHKTYKSSGVKYLKNDSATGIIIPYKKYNPKTGDVSYEEGINLEFIGILPNRSVNEYINNLSNDELNSLLSAATESSGVFEINLSLPRFKYDYNLIEFKSILETLGIRSVFDEELADLTNIISRKTADINNLYVGKAIHKTHIDLNELGTKAAAVTYFGVYNTSMMPPKVEKVDIKFNKPFIYMIRDSKTNEILFFGTVYEPNTWNGSTCSE